MKKKYAILFCFLIAAVGIAGYALRRQERHPGQATAAAQVVTKNAEHTHNRTGATPDVSAVRKIYINVNSIKISPFFRDMQELAQALRKTGTEVVLSGKGSFATGDFNLYAADNIDNLPEIADRYAINVLWLPMVQGSDDAARLRPFDVVVVKSMAAFGHLKAINVRTAYIPDAINIKNPANRRPNGKAMFYGDNRGFSLPLYLAGRADMSVDVYGKGFENVWPTDEIMPDAPQPEDFQTYSAVLLDQSDEAVRDELVSPQVIEVIENGGLPYLRFNSGIYKIFGEALPMYGNEQEFAAGLRELEQNPALVQQRRAALRETAKQWDSVSQAQKFVEIFAIMQQKRR